jgi:hypothetical protein
MWTPLALASEIRPWSGKLWRVVESQSHFSTIKLVDTLADQEVLEAELERSKPNLPPSCGGLHYLLSTPFRYSPYPHGSRFRRARQRDGCFYAGECVETAITETAFYRLLFFLDAPGATLPANPEERSAFWVPAATDRAIDLTMAPLDRDRAIWEHLTNYEPCQALADAAREAGIEAIRYRSVRDPQSGANIALLSPVAFQVTQPAPTASQTWRIFLREASVWAIREVPSLKLEFPFSIWQADPRIPERLSNPSQ